MGMFDKAKGMFNSAKSKAKAGKDKTKAFAIKKMIKSQMKDMPKDRREKMERAIDANPELFQKMAKEMKQKTKNGQTQMSAMMEVSKKYRGELQKLMK
jgi:hypothetical protein